MTAIHPAFVSGKFRRLTARLQFSDSIYAFNLTRSSGVQMRTRPNPAPQRVAGETDDLRSRKPGWLVWMGTPATPWPWRMVPWHPIAGGFGPIRARLFYCFRCCVMRFTCQWLSGLAAWGSSSAHALPCERPASANPTSYGTLHTTWLSVGSCEIPCRTPDKP